MNEWKIRDKIVLFPKHWNKTKVLKWVNAQYIRICPNCDKIDVSYDHFNSCNPSQERVNRLNKEMFEKN